MRASLVLAFASLLGLGLTWDPAREGTALELVYLANEGFLARAGEHSLVIDAFVTEPYGQYAAVPKQLFAALVAAKAPFEDVDLALASHAHRDHFQPRPAAEFVRARGSVRFLSSPQVADELLAELGEHEAAQRVEALLPGARESLAAGGGGIEVELLRLPHSGGAAAADVQNLGHVIALGGGGSTAAVRILHVGDADVGTEELAAYGLAKRAIDVALVPYWWFGSSAGVARAREVTGARHLVAVHVPPEEVADVKRRLAELDGTIVLFEEAGERRALALGEGEKR